MKGARTPTRRYDGGTFGKRENKRLAVPAFGSGELGRDQGRGSCHRSEIHRCERDITKHINTHFDIRPEQPYYSAPAVRHIVTLLLELSSLCTQT